MKEMLAQKSGMLLVPASQTNSATRTANMDTLGGDYATIQVALSSALNTNGVGVTFNLLESNDTNQTNFVTWNSNNNLVAHSIQTQHQVVFKIDTRSRKRYIQLSLSTATATNDNVTASAVYAIGLLGVAQPVASNNLASTNDTVVVS